MSLLVSQQFSDTIKYLYNVRNLCFYWSRAMISRDRHRIAPHKTDLTCMANDIPVIFGTVHVF